MTAMNIFTLYKGAIVLNYAYHYGCTLYDYEYNESVRVPCITYTLYYSYRSGKELLGKNSRQRRSKTCLPL